MTRWLAEWFRAHGGVRAYFSDQEISSIDMDCLSTIVEKDLESGIQRERLLFALVMLAEWTTRYQQRISGFRDRVPEAIREVWAG